MPQITTDTCSLPNISVICVDTAYKTTGSSSHLQWISQVLTKLVVAEPLLTGCLQTAYKECTLLVTIDT